MRNLTVLICLALFSLSAFQASAQDKKPEAIPDFYNVIADVVYPLKPMVNDIVDVGHTARIIQVIGSNTGTLSFDDSTIFYAINRGFKGIDSIKYRIRDNQNGLISDFAIITLNVSNYAYDTLDINNISAMINPYGTLFFNLFKYEEDHHFEFPKGSGLHTMFNMGFSLYGSSSEGDEFISGAIYQQSGGRDFYPGPVSHTEYYGQTYDSAWRKVWKLSKSQIINHIQNFSTEGYSIPQNIRTWPANGKPEEGQAAVLAPYHDFNDNGLYDPENGDYPMIRGDQAIYYIYNDIRSPHTDFNGVGMGAEIHCMVYAFDSPGDEALNNTIFINFMIYNRGNNILNEAKFSIIADADLGNPGDDFAGVHQPLNMGFFYNGDENDEEYEGYSSGYGFHPPAQSVMLLNRNIAGFIPYGTFNNNSSIWESSPNFKQQLINLMNGLWSSGAPLIGNGCGHPLCAQGDTVSFIYTGDPSVAGSWSELQQGNDPGDRSFALLVEPVNDFRPGDAMCIDLALTTARDMNGNHIDSFVLLKEYAAQVQEFYNENFPASCFDVAPGFDEIKSPDDKNQLILYPNPADDVVGLKSTMPLNLAEYLIFDVTGRLRISGRLSGNQNQTIDVKMLKSGLYFVQLRLHDKTVTSKLIKK
ncbi:MAG: hypothetical protein CVT94_17475 [Bacteroidetes bacterium HGW-Bacteroidetes-11]|nr:MAG: hypothetical protein CVT94_17475 [Bacteroidetes bacterium HGW-Bacteroidetes-11]